MAAHNQDDNKTFLDAMNAKQRDPLRPSFTYEEVARCWQIVMGEPIEGNEDFIRDYCVEWFNQERNELCFYK